MSRYFGDFRNRAAGTKRFVLRFWRSFNDSQCLMWATALCYATLLSIVPLMAVTLAIASSFPVFETWTHEIQSFVFENFVPATSEVIQQRLNQFVARASQMSVVGVIFLVASALLLMLSIDGALNRIWGVSKQRNLASRFLSYWTVLTLGPLLMTASVAITSYLVTLPVLAPARATRVADWALQLAPFGISTLGFFIVYLVVPNTRVVWHHALWGAIVAGVLFEVTKNGFALYVTHFPTYQAVYGAFAAIPVFLVWVYLSWLVTLVGATFAATLGDRGEPGSRRVRTCADLVSVYHLLADLWEAQTEGEGLSLEELRSRESELSVGELRGLLNRLADASFVRSDGDDERWFLIRDASHATLLQLLRAIPVTLPDPDRIRERASSRDRALASAVGKLNAAIDSAFDRPLREFFEAGPSGA